MKVPTANAGEVGTVGAMMIGGEKEILLSGVSDGRHPEENGKTCGGNRVRALGFFI